MPQTKAVFSVLAFAVATAFACSQIHSDEPAPVSKENSTEPEVEYDLLWESYDLQADKWFAWLQIAKDKSKAKLFEADGPPREHVPPGLQHPTWSSDGQRLAYYLYVVDDYLIYEYDMAKKSSRELTVGSLPTYDPSGKRLAYLANSSKTGENEVWIYDKTGSDDRVTNLAQGCLWPSWSPDGKRILFNSFDRTWNLYLLDVGSGQSKPYTKGKRAIEKAIWSPDGKQIAYWILSTDEIVIADLDGKTISKIEGDEGTPRVGNFSPDGKRIVFTRLNDGGLFVHECATHKTKELCRMNGYTNTCSYSPDGKWIAFQFNATSPRKTGGRWDVYVVPVSGGKPICLTSDFDDHSIAPCWRPRAD